MDGIGNVGPGGFFKKIQLTDDAAVMKGVVVKGVPVASGCKILVVKAGNAQVVVCLLSMRCRSHNIDSMR